MRQTCVDVRLVLNNTSNEIRITQSKSNNRFLHFMNSTHL